MDNEHSWMQRRWKAVRARGRFVAMPRGARRGAGRDDADGQRWPLISRQTVHGLLHRRQGPQSAYLHPLRAASGTMVNRSGSGRAAPGETTDHPHHAGLFYGHGDVNGYNFWAIQNVPDPAAAKADSRWVASCSKSGVGQERQDVRHRGRRAHVAEAGREAAADRNPEDDLPCASRRSASSISISTSRPSTKWCSATPRKARSRCAWRRRSRSRPPRKTGRARENGQAPQREGGEREANVWGKQAAWVDYSGVLDGEQVGIVMMDHPGNPRHPTYWHSRGYGLHSINPFGLHDFLNDKTQNGSLTSSRTSMCGSVIAWSFTRV